MKNLTVLNNKYTLNEYKNLIKRYKAYKSFVNCINSRREVKVNKISEFAETHDIFELIPKLPSATYFLDFDVFEITEESWANALENDSSFNLELLLSMESPYDEAVIELAYRCLISGLTPEMYRPEELGLYKILDSFNTELGYFNEITDRSENFFTSVEDVSQTLKRFIFADGFLLFHQHPADVAIFLGDKTPDFKAIQGDYILDKFRWIWLSDKFSIYSEAAYYLGELLGNPYGKLKNKIKNFAGFKSLAELFSSLYGIETYFDDKIIYDLMEEGIHPSDIVKMSEFDVFLWDTSSVKFFDELIVKFKSTGAYINEQSVEFFKYYIQQRFEVYKLNKDRFWDTKSQNIDLFYKIMGTSMHDSIPDIFFKLKDGSTFRKLNKVECMFAGEKHHSNCCQVFGDAAQSAMVHSCLSEKAGVYALVSPSGEFIFQTYVWENKYGEFILDSFESRRDFDSLVERLNEVLAFLANSSYKFHIGLSPYGLSKDLKSAAWQLDVKFGSKHLGRPIDEKEFLNKYSSSLDYDDDEIYLDGENYRELLPL